MLFFFNSFAQIYLDLSLVIFQEIKTVTVILCLSVDLLRSWIFAYISSFLLEELFNLKSGGCVTLYDFLLGKEMVGLFSVEKGPVVCSFCYQA